MSKETPKQTEDQINKFKKDRQTAAEEIEHLKDVASDAINEATKLADKYGIVFYVSLINQHNVYAPERPKDMPADMCMSDDYEDPEDESYEYEGWQTSGC